MSKLEKIMEVRDIAFHKIKEASGLQETACSCSACQSMCRNVPCLGTPEDIAAIMEAGFGHNLSKTIWGVDARNGTGPLIDMIQPMLTSRGCIFLNPDGKCDLHERGLKPTEGRLAHHAQAPTPLAKLVAEEWKNFRTFMENHEAHG